MQMANYDDDIGLESFMQRATRISQRLSACHPHEAAHQPSAFTNSPSVPEPMQMDSTRLARAERTRRLAARLCLYCGAPGHFLRACPVRPPCPSVSTLQVDPEIATLSLLSVKLLIQDRSISVSALVDSGSSGNFISHDLLRRLHLPHQRQAQELRVETIQGKPLGHGRVQFHTPPLKLQIGCLHEETISFLVLEGPTVDIILGRPWLTLHSPEVRWEPCVASTLIESPESQETPSFPSDYAAFQDVISKQAATILPPHRPWDCAIDLLPWAKLPKGRVYPLSIPECKAMEDYIREARQQGFIQPSTSPAASSFFFVGKKDGGLRPCIDYRMLNSQTVKLPYPLPLVPAALEELRGARIFCKLDLRSAYNLVRIREDDEWKTAFITPAGHYEYRVMPYGLSNSPSVFQSFMNEVFREFLNKFVIVYIDDILIYSRNLAEHRHHVTQVLQKLRQHQLFLKLEKCEFHRSTIQFLGYVINQEGIQMDQGKVKTIENGRFPSR